MAKDKKCPKCGSDNIEIVNVAGSDILICNSCGYDESESLDIVAENRGGKKGRNVYRKGGGKRSVVKVGRK